ncbi:hypothetical protein BD289DRAFT_482697 [Coniella lustricola]|uniref:Zn(2)-C6 fungal-type domain-containing protein n=1 Tax=Coniella lustricola TaxID=2025994 RepID=A0A2T3A7Y6_9PEZI|nr:hypothetical protein BD289DRAFT_482697 [Coniella lustricola]
MVYCGKPSKGCQMCRTRRIKCDETKPACTQCTKTRRTCPGYKDNFDLIFHNETKSIERRAQKAGSRKGSAAPAVANTTPSTTIDAQFLTVSSSGDREGKRRDSSGSSSGSGGSTVGSSPTASSVIDGTLSPLERLALLSPSGEVTLCQLPSVPTDQLARCHFLSNFILVPRQGSTRGFMDYLLPLIQKERSSSHFQCAFNACSLAHLGNRVRSEAKDLPNLALNEYTKALATTHTALQDPVLSETDGTLAAVLLLGLYENITATEMGVFSWGSHIEGAISLVKTRGRKQLRTKTGLLLFIAVRTQMAIHTVASGKAPIMDADWWMSDAVKDTISAECQHIHIKTGELAAKVTQLLGSANASSRTMMARTPDNMELMRELIKRAQVLDAECIRWMKKVPDGWQWRTVAWEDSVPGGDFARAEVFPGRVDAYGDFYIASVWNLARISRLVLACVVVRCAAWACSPVDYRTTPEYATATRTCVDMITDIIASVPYHLGWHLKPERKHLLEKQLSGFACGEEDSLKGLAGYFLTWPLGCIQAQDYTTDSQRQWIKGRLKYIADEMGVKYAHIICKLNVRIPSMLIRKDTMNPKTLPTLTTRCTPPTTNYTMDPLQQHDFMLQSPQEYRSRNLLHGASTSAGPGVDHRTKSWLSV